VGRRNSERVKEPDRCEKVACQGMSTFVMIYLWHAGPGATNISPLSGFRANIVFSSFHLRI